MTKLRVYDDISSNFRRSVVDAKAFERMPPFKKEDCGELLIAEFIVS